MNENISITNRKILLSFFLYLTKWLNMIYCVRSTERLGLWLSFKQSPIISNIRTSVRYQIASYHISQRNIDINELYVIEYWTWRIVVNKKWLFELFEWMNYGHTAHILDAFVQNICEVIIFIVCFSWWE